MNGKNDPMAKLGRLDLQASVEVCTPCHARKRIYKEKVSDREDFHQVYAPDVWQQGGYFVDGRSRSLNYRWVDFMQNRCTPRSTQKLDCGYCHPPHSLHSVKHATVTESNQICTSCHLKHKTQLKAHTHHGVESDGSRCVACHMPKMDLDLRMTVRDHTISSPLPSISAQYEGVPNACNQCHKKAGEDVAWAVKWVEAWYGEQPNYQAYKKLITERAAVLKRVFSGDTPVAELIAWLDDTTLNVVQRSSAAGFLGKAFGDPNAEAALLRHINDPDPLVRYYVTRGLAPYQSAASLTAMRRALQDPVRTVRVSAYEGLFYTLPQIDKDPDPTLTKVREEFRERRDRVRVDDPRDSSTLAYWFFSRGNIKEAEKHLRRGVALAPRLPRTRADLVQFLLQAGQIDEAVTEVEVLLKLAPNSQATLLAHGLTLLSQKRPAEAIVPLQRLVDSGRADTTVTKALELAKRAVQIGILPTAPATAPEPNTP